MIYLNQAGSSWPKPDPVREAVTHALTAPPEVWAERLDAQHRFVASSFGVPEPEQLLLTPGATSALASAFRAVRWESGDRVLVSGLEHQALLGPAKSLESLGVEVVVAPRTDSEPVVLDFVEALLRQGRVRMLAMTTASNVTGEILPIEAIVSLARRYGAISVIDAAQTAGWWPLNLPSLGADFVAFAGHKGPQAPWGIGGLYIAPSVASAKPGYCEVGSVDRIALAGLEAGLRWLDGVEQQGRLERARVLAEKLAASARNLPGVTLYGPTAPTDRMPTVAMTARGWTPSELARVLATRGVAASGGQQCAELAHESLGTGADGVLRFSVGPANDDADVETAAQLLSEVLSDGPVRIAT